MTRHKGMASRTGVTQSDLREVLDCFRRIQRLEGSLHYTSPQKIPLMAASATLKACWTELSGQEGAWSYPADLIPADGLALKADRSGKPSEDTFMDTSIFGRRD